MNNFVGKNCSMEVAGPKTEGNTARSKQGFPTPLREQPATTDDHLGCTPRSMAVDGLKVQMLLVLVGNTTNNGMGCSAMAKYQSPVVSKGNQTVPLRSVVQFSNTKQ
jgi:hypothetical protein